MSELLNEEEVLEQEEQTGFVVDDDQKAEWCLNKIREAEANKEFWKNHYDQQYQKVCAAEDAKIERMRFYLERYFWTIPHKETKTQASYALPSGKLVVKHQGPEYERNDDEIIDWMAEHGDEMHFIKVKQSVDWAEFKKVLTQVGENMVTEDGEIVPGIKVVDRPDVFKVEVK